MIAAVLALGLLAAAGQARAEGVFLKYKKTLYTSGGESDASKAVKLDAPEGVACDDAGAVVVADTGNRRLVLYKNTDGQVTAGTEVKIAELPYPTRVQLDSKGNILALDRKTKQIVRLNARGALVNVMQFKNAPEGTTVVPAGFKLDKSDNLYVLDVAQGRVVVADTMGSVTRVIPLPAGNATFTDVAVDSAGTIYAVDAAEGAVWSAPAAAKEFKQIGKGGKDYMNFASYITTNNKGTLVVVDQNGHGLVALGTDGAYLGRQLGMGWSEGYLYYPAQLCMTPNGSAFIADRGNNRVQMFTVAK